MADMVEGGRGDGEWKDLLRSVGIKLLENGGTARGGEGG